jgi:hypothetical protein
MTNMAAIDFGSEQGFRFAVHSHTEYRVAATCKESFLVCTQINLQHPVPTKERPSDREQTLVRLHSLIYLYAMCQCSRRRHLRKSPFLEVEYPCKT